MRSYHVVWFLVLLITVAAKKDNTTWDPWCETGAKCTCAVVHGLNSITCTHTGIVRTPINGFAFPGGTQVADLSSNKLYVLRDYAFNQYFPGNDEGLDLLLKLNFSRNSIQRIALNAFTYVDNLTILDLSHNKIDRLNPNTFENMTKLKELYLQHNEIETLEAFTFKGLNSLNILDLSYCQISKIYWWAFHFSNSAKLLNLQNNNLTTFHTNYIFSPQSLDFHQGINLLNNPIICDCGLKRFYFDTHIKVGKYNLTCSGPKKVLNYRLTALVEFDFLNCNTQSMLSHSDDIVEGIASETTTLSCHTNQGPLFKNWTITSKVDGQDTAVWPDRFQISESSTWINLTITDTQKSDEGTYQCLISERIHGSMRWARQDTTLVVRERELTTMILRGEVGEEQEVNDTFIEESSSDKSNDTYIEESSSDKSNDTYIEELSSDKSNDTYIEESSSDESNDTHIEKNLFSDGPSLGLVLGINAILALFVVMVMVIAIRMISRRKVVVTEYIYRPSDRTSHMYEDVDQVLIRLAQRSLPRLPDHPYASVQPQPQPQSQSSYLQHFMAMRRPLLTPSSSISSMSTNGLTDEYNKAGPYDNALYLDPPSSQSSQQGDKITNKNMKFIAVEPTYSQLPTGINQYC